MESIHAGQEQFDQAAAICKLKKAIRPNPEEINAAWTRLLAAIEREAKVIKEKGPDIVPQLDFATLHANQGYIPSDIAAEVRRRGVLVIHNVIPTAQAHEYKASVVEYLEHNAAHIPAAQADGVFRPAFYSKAQIQARQHRNTVEVLTAMNRLWHGGDDGKGRKWDPEKPLTYCDAMRIRQPGRIFHLGPHIDSGGIDRWYNEEYRKVYDKIFEGKWEDYDPFDITHRLECDLPSNKFFRSFQGWLSLNHCSPGEGTLRVCPILPLQTAYYMMRPFVADFPDEAWPGVHAQNFDDERFREMTKCFVSIPSVGPGDMAFWHCDLAHAVETHHMGQTDSTVFYIPAAPLCELNARYARVARDSFLQGIKGPDFVGRDHGDVGVEIKFEGRAGLRDLSELGRKLMGFEPWEGEGIAKRCGEIVRV